MAQAHRPQRRSVRSEDRSLSQEANRQLTEELREAVGRDEATVSEERLARARERHATHGGLVATLASNRLYIAISFLVMVVVGAAIALATGSWWVFVAALGLHAIGTLLVTGLALQLTTETEHLSPAVAARLEDEGVADPDRVFTELVEDYAGDERQRRARDIVETGANELTVRPEDDPGRAAVEQRTAMTPAGAVSAPSGSGSPIAAMPALVVAGTCLVALIAAIAAGGWMWLAAAVVWAAAIGWFLLQRAVDARAEERAAARRRGGGPDVGGAPPTRGGAPAGGRPAEAPPQRPTRGGATPADDEPRSGRPDG